MKMFDKSVAGGREERSLSPSSPHLDKKIHKGYNTIEEYSWGFSNLKHIQRTLASVGQLADHWLT